MAEDSEVQPEEDLAGASDLALGGDDVFMPNPVKMDGVEDYYAAREALAWTGASDYWPDIDETDWIVLSGDATLISDSRVVAVVKEADTSVTVTSGNNMIFADTSSVTINQNGGVSEVYYDPTSEVEINVNIVGGVAALSKLSPDFSQTVESVNTDGSRTLTTNQAKINYNTGETGSVLLSDVVTGSVKRAIPTNTLKAPVEESAADSNQPTEELQESERPNNIPNGVGGGAAPAPASGAPAVDFEIFNLITRLQPEEEGADPIEIIDELFEDDVLITDEMTEVSNEYLNVPIVEDWQLRSESYVSASNDKIELAFARQADQIELTKSTQTYNKKSEETVDDVLAMESWDDLLPGDIMDLFYEE